MWTKSKKEDRVEENQQSRGAYNTCCSQGGVETFGAAVPVTTVGLYLVQLFDSVPGTAAPCCGSVLYPGVETFRSRIEV